MNLQAWNVIIEYSSTYFSLRLDPRYCFHPISPEGFIDERNKQLKILKLVGFRTRIAHISFTPSWSSVLTRQFSQLYCTYQDRTKTSLSNS